jgi:hypothetical protein
LANAGIDLGSLMDYTGTTYAHRNTIGAYQGSAAYRAQQSLSTVAPLATENSDSIVHLPSTTDQGLPVTYTIVSGPAQLNGNTLTFTGVGTVTLSATQPGSSADASLSVAQSSRSRVPLGSVELANWLFGQSCKIVLEFNSA